MSGYVYLLHFERPIGRPQSDEARAEHELPPRREPYRPHARHYLGSADDLAARLESHWTGNGARLVAVATARCIRWTVARVWLAEDHRRLEHSLKALKHNPRLCPICSRRPRPACYPGARELSAAEITEALIPF